MTTFNAATDVPSNINTLEKLAAWVGLALQRCNPNTAVLEAQGLNAEKVASAILFKADDGSTRLGLRISLAIDEGYGESTKKFWEHAKEFPQSAVLPAAFKVN